MVLNINSIGCGYKRAEDQADRGMVYFTCNGERLAEGVDGVQTGLWPVLHIQKKVTHRNPLTILLPRSAC